MMYIGISIIICSLFYSLLISITYFLKPHLVTKETKLYKNILVVNLFNLALELGCFATISVADRIPILAAVISRLFLFSLLTWNIIFSAYIFIVGLNITSKSRKKYMFLILLEVIFYITGALTIAIVPLNYYYENNTMYSYGFGADYVTIIYTVNLFISLLIAIVNIKKIEIKKIFPLFLLTLLTGLCVVIRTLEPGLNIISGIMAFVTVLMYHTIENPDMKLINELELAKKDAERANIAKTEFLSNMSHEIRTPLNAIVGFSNSIIEDGDINQARSDAKDIIMASNNLLEIVNGILDISKIEAGKMEIVNTNYNPVNMFDDLVKLIKPRIGEKPIELRTNFSADIPGILYGDNGKVKEIVTNILTNAAKYTDEGYIDFNVSCINNKNECKLIISVEDTGRGIQADKIDKLFTKFNRLEEDKNTTLEGTGLGLAITKSLVEMMGGKIVVQSKYGSGSKFTIYLSQKIVSMVDNRASEKENVIKNNNYSERKVLVVDDNNLNIKVAVRMLRNYKIIPDTVLSSQECLDMVKNNKYDLILMDDMMPKMSGTETLNKLKEDNNFDIPVVVLTANAISGMKEKYIKDGFSDYLAKPIDRLELDKVLNKYLNKKS